MGDTSSFDGNKLDAYDLAPGEHRFILHGWGGGALLDAIIFTNAPDFSAEGLIGLPTAPTDSASTVQTGPIRPSRVKRWGKLAWVGMALTLLGGCGHPAGPVSPSAGGIVPR